MPLQHENNILTAHLRLMQEMRTYKEAEQAGRDCGFELVLSYDVATASPVAGPWYGLYACPLP